MFRRVSSLFSLVRPDSIIQYMTELDHGDGVRVGILGLDLLEALFAEIAQGCLDVGVAGWIDAEGAVCQDNRVDHRIDCSLACAWEQLHIWAK